MVKTTKRITRAITKEQVEARKNEIIQACYNTYLEKGLKETSIKDLGGKVSFTRSSIYNYYRTKEEIFLDMLRNEYDILSHNLDNIYKKDNLSLEDVSKEISLAIGKRKVLLQIISSSLNELEKYSRIEYLVNFKTSFGKCIDQTREILRKFTNLSLRRIEVFIELFFPFLFGLCGYTVVSARQAEAMQIAKVNWHTPISTEELCYDFIIEFIKGEN